MTNINFTFSPTLTTQLQQPGVYAYAVSFYTPAGGSSTAGPTATLVSNGTISQTSMTMPTNFPSGAVYVVIQQGGTGSLLGQLTTIGSVNPTSAATNNYSYQLFEASLTPSVFDQGDISALNTFGFPSSYSVVSGGQTLSLGFAPNQSGNGIYTALGNAQTFTGGGNALSIGPATANNAAPFPASDWQGYINALKNNAAALADITLVVPYAGGTTLQANPMLSQYGVRYVATDPTFGNDFFWLVPNTMNGATNTDWIYVPAQTSTATAGSLMQNIYVQPGPLLVYPDNGSGQPSTTPKPPPAGGSFTPNNADGAVAKFLVAGFDAGYWGGSGTSANPKDPTVSDLSKTWNWNVNYAYDATITSTTIKYSNSLSTSFYDRWAQEIQSISNAYGYSYTDLVSLGGTNPQITLWDPSLGTNVANINISLYANSETLPATSGFTPSPAVYVPPPNGTAYSSVNTATSGNINQLGFAFQFGLGSPALNFAPNGSTPAVFKFYAPGDAMADKTTGFVSLTLPVLPGTIASSNTPESSIWNILTVQGGPGNWSLASNAGANPYSQQQGQFNIYNVPVTSDGTTGWYQLVFGASGSQTVYNIYANNKGGVFQPITGTGSSATNFVVDHGVEVTPASNPGYYTLNFAPGGNMLYDVNTLSAPSTIFGTNAANTLTGTSGNNPINGGPGNDTIHGGDGIDTAVSWEAAKNFTLKHAAGSSTITVQDKVGTDGTDSLTSIEKIQFRDTAIDTTWITKTAALPADQIMKVVDLYTAGLNRAPDAVGLDYWASRLADGTSIAEISKAIFSSAEAAPIYSSANSNAVFVDLAYQTALGRAPDAAGAGYWLSTLNAQDAAAATDAQAKSSEFVSALIAGAQGPDAQYIANKGAVGAHFALTQGLNNVAWARLVESGVNGTAASMTAANAQTDAFAATAATSAGSELVVQITGIVP
jgi:hypothetical protein